jgi:hypothetical protein
MSSKILRERGPSPSVADIRAVRSFLLEHEQRFGLVINSDWFLLFQ